MQHLSTRGLLNVRLVAKKWEEEATIQLLSTRQSHQVKFAWDGKEFRNKVGSLEEFTENYYVNPLRTFPCSQFYFRWEFSLELEFAPALSKFFSNHGHHVKSLHFSSKYDFAPPLEIVRKIVFEWTPKLKSFTLKGEIWDGGFQDKLIALENENASKSSPEDDQKISKLSLEHLKISYHVNGPENSARARNWSLLITDILSSAPNLKTVSDPKLRLTKEIVTAGKISAVQRLVLLVWEETMSHLVEFSQARPKLMNFEVDLITGSWTTRRNCRINFLTSLQLILQSSQKTLMTLKFSGRIDSFNGASQLNIPVMKNVQEFRVSWWSSLEGGLGRFLPEGFSVQTLFPRLKRLAIEGVGVTTTNQEDNPFGQSCNSSTTVEELTIVASWSHGYPLYPDWLRQARDLYPNVRVLKLDLHAKEWSEIPEICRTIWTFWKESLLQELIIFLPNRKYTDCAELMDRALTGFDRETCKMLQEQRKRCRKHGLEAEAFERGPSIVDMKEMKLFQLINGWKSPYPLLSWLSVIHALEPMKRSQNLRVSINGVELTEMIQNGLNLGFSKPGCEMKMDE